MKFKATFNLVKIVADCRKTSFGVVFIFGLLLQTFSCKDVPIQYKRSKGSVSLVLGKMYICDAIESGHSSN